MALCIPVGDGLAHMVYLAVDNSCGHGKMEDFNMATIWSELAIDTSTVFSSQAPSRWLRVREDYESHTWGLCRDLGVVPLLVEGHG